MLPQTARPFPSPELELVVYINIMKTLKCDLCEVTADGETFEEWMQALRPHYGEAHADVMNDSSRTKEHMEQWMAENKARFEAA